MLPLFAVQVGKGNPSGQAITWGTEWRHCCQAAGKLRRARASKEKLHRLQGALAWLGCPWRVPHVVVVVASRNTWADHAGHALSGCQGRNTGSSMESGDQGWRPLRPVVEVSWRWPNTEVLERTLALALILPAFEFQVSIPHSYAEALMGWYLEVGPLGDS